MIDLDEWLTQQRNDPANVARRAKSAPTFATWLRDLKAEERRVASSEGFAQGMQAMFNRMGAALIAVDNDLWERVMDEMERMDDQ